MNHVAFLIPTLDRIGGAERQLILLAKGLCRRGWRVTVVALSGTGSDAATELTEAGVGFLSLRMRKGLADPRGWFHFKRWLEQEHPDVVHAHLPHAAWLARWSRLGVPVRVVVDTLHSSSTGSFGRSLGYRLSCRLPDKVTAVSRSVAEAHLFAGMVLAGQLAVLPNGVDVRYFRPDAEVRRALRQKSGVQEGEFLWFAAGRLEPVKDYPTLLRAMAKVPERARLAIAGGGILENKLRQISATLGLTARVRFLGFEADVRPWMQAADGFVLCSHWEGLPMALLEAAACALPAVATDVPGTREAVVHRQTGLLAAAGSEQALQEAMSQIMSMPPEQLRAMGRQARQHVIDGFSLSSALDRWESLYEALLTENPKPRRWGRAV